MIDFLYDGSFEGLLTCIYNNYYKENCSGIYNKSTYQYSLINTYEIIDTNFELSKIVYDAIIDKISKHALNNVYYMYLSNHKEKENLILYYLKFGFKIGKDIDNLHTHDIVHPVHKYAKKVGLEAHKFLGLLRFIEVENILYAGLTPDHNIIELIADHFADRLKNEKFIIHDKARDIAVIYNQNNWYMSDFKLKNELPISNNEHFYQNLWQGYFDNIGIDSRKNKRLQAQYMPRRYWKNLIENPNNIKSF